jgi:hypothetical protein
MTGSVHELEIESFYWPINASTGLKEISKRNDTPTAIQGSKEG